MSQAGKFFVGGGGGGVVETLTGNSGGPVGPTGFNIDLLGGTNILSVGDAGTSTITFNLIDSPVLAGYLTINGQDGDGSSLIVNDGNILIANEEDVPFSTIDFGIRFHKSRAGGTVETNDPLGVLLFEAADNGVGTNGAKIVSIATGDDFDGRSLGADLEFFTHPNGVSQTDPTQRMVIASTGAVTINNPDDTVDDVALTIGSTVDDLNQALKIINGNSIIGYVGDNGNTSVFYMTKSRGTGNPIVGGEDLGKILFKGDVLGTEPGAPTDYAQGAQILATVPAGLTYGAGRLPTNLIFSTAPNSISGAITRMTIDYTGAITIPNLAGGLITSTNLGVLSNLGFGANGTLPIGSVGASPVLATLTAGTNISITNGPGSISIASTGIGSFGWTSTSASLTMTVFTGYIVGSSGSPIDLLLPATAAVGSVIKILLPAKGAGTVRITQGASQTIFGGLRETTIGAAGYVDFNQSGNAIEIICISPNVEWQIASSVGNFTFN